VLVLQVFKVVNVLPHAVELVIPLLFWQLTGLAAVDHRVSLGLHILDQVALLVLLKRWQLVIAWLLHSVNLTRDLLLRTVLEDKVGTNSHRVALLLLLRHEEATGISHLLTTLYVLNMLPFLVDVL
jgi:hypothetical protein